MPKLSLEVISDTEISVDRYFNAPPDRVFDAFYNAETLKQWMWAMEAPLDTCNVDMRAGGEGRFEWRLPDGNLMRMSLRFLEFDPPNRTVHEEEYEQDWTGGPTTITTVFTANGQGTQVQMTIAYRSKAGRDAALASPMAEGMEETYGKLDAYLA